MDLASKKTTYTMKVWRDFLRGTPKKDIADLLQPVTEATQNSYGQLAFPTFHYQGMRKQSSLMATISQYPKELLLLFGWIHISDGDGLEIMQCVKNIKVYAGSDGSVNDWKGGHAFCITDH